MVQVSTEPVHIKTGEIIAGRGAGPWYEQVLNDGRNVAGLICDAPGGSNDDHFHPDFNEWWIVLKGETEFEIGDYPVLSASKGDLVVSPAGTRHLIRTVGSEDSVRLHVSKIGSNHDNKKARSSQLVAFPEQTDPPNLLHTTLDFTFEKFGEPPWSTALVADDLNRANLICHGPGMSNNAHWHPDFDEWWTILKGELTWEIGEDRPLYHVGLGDIIFVPRGMRHHISCVGDESSLRLAVTTPEALHIFTDDDASAHPPRA